ncbi:MAG TPA: metallophosphoesterase family protein [Xanthobacteraceae bacterium]|nr:metallophosphoesterase family protein [Xanthobacteraceae bacterium]
MSILKLDGAAVPSRIYAIGDIHGRLDLLDRLIASIEQDIAAHGGTGALVVTLGDYVDRGPDSRGVIERLASNPFSVPLVPLAGNHEEMFLSFLSQPRSGVDWCRRGGIDTLRSYGVPVNQIVIGRGYSAASETMNWLMPEAHRGFLQNLRLGVLTPDYFLCHAGVRPGVPLEQQKPSDLLWITEPFLTATASFGRIVVHGHTIVPQVEIHANRINIDTGAYQTGRLSCLVLEGGEAYTLTATD